MMYRVVFVHMVLNATRAIRNARTSRASRRSYESAWQQYNFILLAFSLFTECLTSLPLSPFFLSDCSTRASPWLLSRCFIFLILCLPFMHHVTSFFYSVPLIPLSGKSTDYSVSTGDHFAVKSLYRHTARCYVF